MRGVTSHGTGYVYGHLAPNYTCDVYFDGREITVDQRLWVHLKASLEPEYLDDGRYNIELNAVDYRVTDKYEISVDQNGQLQIANTYNHLEDHSDQLPRVSDLLHAIIEIVLQAVIGQIKSGLVSQV